MTEAAALVIIAIAWIVMFIVFVVARAMMPRALHYGEAQESETPRSGRGAV